MPLATPRDLDLKSYQAWLEKEGYQTSTVEVSLRHIRTSVANPKKVPPHRVAHIQRYLRFVLATQKNPAGGQFTRLMKTKHGLSAATAIKKQGKRKAIKLDDKQLSELRAKLRRDKKSDTSQLLVAYMQSGRRITEFLNLTPAAVSKDETIDKISRDWIRSFKVGKLYQILCKTERCAYARMRRLLALEAADTKISLDTLYQSKTAA